MKRVLDVILASFGLVFLCVPLVILSLLIAIVLRKPVLFRQKRPGLYGKPFLLYKFRTMSTECNELGEMLPDYLRVSKFGLWLRRTSLDELPTLWNVLIGDMSIVGPRPLLMEYLELYSPEQMSRHDVKPGITGWAQVNGRNKLSWDEKFKHDVWYVNNHNLWLDIKIIVLTFVSVLKSSDVTQDGHPTTEKFKGSKSV